MGPRSQPAFLRAGQGHRQLTYPPLPGATCPHSGVWEQRQVALKKLYGKGWNPPSNSAGGTLA